MHPAHPPLPAEQEQSPHCRNVRLLPVDDHVRVHRQVLRYFLRAVAKASPVPRSLSLILRNRLARRLPPARVLAPPTTHPEWRDAAEVWLAELRRTYLSTADLSGAG
jgi:hypothetical protein